MIQVEFHGAAQGVTGSMHLVHAPEAKVLLECGLYQGRRNESLERNRNLPLRARDLDAVVLDVRGETRLHTMQSGPVEDAALIAERAAAALVEQGATDLLQDARS